MGLNFCSSTAIELMGTYHTTNLSMLLPLLITTALVNLPAFLIGKGASAAEIDSFPDAGDDGLDVNGDGEYCGPGERYPLPARRPLDFFGKEYSFVAPEGQPIVDFDFEPTRGLLAMVVRSAAGQEAIYQTVYARGGVLSPDEGKYALTGLIPRRVALMAAVPLQRADGSRTARDLAIISIEGQPSKLIILDLSDPLHPSLLTTINAPTAIAGQAVDFGNVQSIQRRADGLLALATTTDVILLDPAKLLLPPASEGGISPAIVGIISGAGSGARSFSADSTGQNLVNLGGKRALIQTPPFIDLITFGDGRMFSQTAWPGMSDTQKRVYWASNQSASLLLKTRLTFDAGNSTLLNSTSAHPYYVRLDAPGKAGPFVALVIESMDSSGRTMVPGGTESLPVRLAPNSVRQAVGDTNTRPYVMTMKARRLSDTPSSEFYNTYLSEPLLLTSQIYSPQQRDLVRASGPSGTGILKAGAHLWAGLAPSPEGEPPTPVIGRFASRTTGNTVIPGINTRRPVEKPRPPLVLIPGIAGSHLEDSSTGCVDDRCANVTERWPGYLSSLQAQLTLDPEQSRTAPPIVATDVIRQIPEEYGCAPGTGLKKVYQPLIEYLTREAGYVEYNHTKSNGQFVSSLCMPGLRTRSGFDQTQLVRNPNFFVFPYDWRKSNAETADELARFVDFIRLVQPDADQVDMVAHSMGGLVARRFILDHPGKVGKLVTLGTPWLGAPKAFAALETGDFDDIVLNLIVRKSVLKSLAEFFPGMHELLPSQAMFDFGAAPIVERGWDINQDGIHQGALNYGQFRQMLDMKLHPRSKPGTTNASFHNFQNSQGHQDDWRNDNTGVEYHHIFGMQTLPQTISRVVASTWFSSIPSTTNNTVLDLAPVEIFDAEQPGAADQFVSIPDSSAGIPLSITGQQFVLEKTLETVRGSGDGTVPLLSAARGAGSSADLNAPGARLHPIVSSGQSLDEKANHNEMLANKIMQNWVAGILNDDLPPVAQVTIHADETAIEGHDILFDASFTVPEQGTAPPSGDTVFLWDFGDGATQREVAPGVSAVTHRYRDNGTFIVSCGVALDDGRVTGFSSRSVRVVNANPTVTIEGGDLTVPAGSTRLISARVTDEGVDDTHRVHWEVSPTLVTNDGPGIFAANFPTNGDYTVKATVKDDDGGEATTQVTVHVVPAGQTPPTPLTPAPSATRQRHAATPASGLPQLYVRVSGQLLSDLGGDGIDIENENQRDYSILDIPVRTVQNLITKVQRAAIDALTDSASGNSVFVNVFRGEISEGNTVRQTATTTLKLQGRGDVLFVDAFYKEGGITKQYAAWRTSVSSGTDVTVSLDWENKSLEMKVGNETATPRLQLTGTEAENTAAPAITAVLNPADRRVYVAGYDALTSSDRLDYFIAQDSNGDGDFTDEIFYQLSQTNVYEMALPTRPCVVVACDAGGHLSGLDVLHPLQAIDWNFGLTSGSASRAVQAAAPANTPDDAPCTRLTARRATIRTVVDEAMQSPALQKFALGRQYENLWILEQGSGACLWKSDPCSACAGVYDLNTSDNDYELFLPVHLSRNLQLNYEDREEFYANDPYSDFNLTGDWYFKRPLGLDQSGLASSDINQVVIWRYQLPPGITYEGQTVLDFDRLPDYENMERGFPDPLRPAEAMALIFTRTVTNDAVFRAELKDTTFFPARREHFLFGVGDLERPPKFGTDPIGDAGLGRNMLLLKWLLEGEYVSLGDGPAPVNGDAPRLNDVFTNLVARTIPVAEGLEWATYQEFAALKAKPQLFASVQEPGGPNATPAGIHDSLRKRQDRAIRSLGKAAIRTALARITGDISHNGSATATSPEQYRQQGIKSFEAFVLKIASEQSELYGEFAADLPDFYRAKVGDRDFLDSIAPKERYEAFARRCFAFMRRIQSDTLTTYRNYLNLAAQQGKAPEYNQRMANLRTVLGNCGSVPESPGIQQMTTDSAYRLTADFRVRVSRFGYEALSDATVKIQSEVNHSSTSVSARANNAVIISGDANNGTLCRLTRTLGSASSGTQVATLTLIAGSEHEHSLADNTIKIETSLMNPGGSPLSDEGCGPEVRAMIVITNDKPAILFRLVDASGNIIPGDGQNIILRNAALEPPAGQFITNCVEIGNLPAELLGPTALVAQGMAGGQPSRNLILIATSLDQLYRDGIRDPTEAETGTLRLLNEAATICIQVKACVAFIRSVLTEVGSLAENAATPQEAAMQLQAYALQANVTFIDSPGAYRAFGSPAYEDPATFLPLLDSAPPATTYNPGRQLKSGPNAGQIYVNQVLMDRLQNGNQPTLMPGGLSDSLTAIKAELYHEMNSRLSLRNLLIWTDSCPGLPGNKVLDCFGRGVHPFFTPAYQLWGPDESDLCNVCCAP